MIVLHIGMGKCGSSTLQEFLVSNEAVLRTISIDYPTAGRKLGRSAHHNIANEIQGRRRQRFFPELGTLPELVEHHRSQTFRTTVLSSEMFKNAEVDEIATLKVAFEQSAPIPKFSILLVIRDLSNFVRSRYVKRIKYGDHVYDFDEYFSEVFLQDKKDFFEIGQKWAHVFGWSSMNVWALDSRALLNGDLLDEFMALLSTEIRVGAGDGPRRTESRNISPGWKTVEAVRALYSGTSILVENHPLVVALPELGPRQIIGKTANKVGEQYGWNSDKGRYLTREQAEICYEKYSLAIDSFNAFLTRKLPSPTVPDPKTFRIESYSPRADMIPKAELEEFYEDLWWHVSRKLTRSAETESAG